MTQSEIRIREGCAGDELALRAIHEASWRETYAPFVPAGAFEAPLRRVMARRWNIWPTDRSIWVAQAAGPIGFAAALARGHGHWSLDSLHIIPIARGQRAGLALLAYAAAHICGEGGRSMSLEVLSGNVRARKFYVAHGAREGVAQDNMLLGYPADYVAMHWDLEGLGALAKKSANRV